MTCGVARVFVNAPVKEKGALIGVPGCNQVGSFRGAHFIFSGVYAALMHPKKKDALT